MVESVELMSDLPDFTQARCTGKMSYLKRSRTSSSSSGEVDSRKISSDHQGSHEATSSDESEAGMKTTGEELLEMKERSIDEPEMLCHHSANPIVKLEEEFNWDKYADAGRREELSKKLNLTEAQVSMNLNVLI